MAMMNALIPMSGRVPDFIGGMRGARMAADEANASDRGNALMALYQAQGPQIASGDQNAMNALARFDPAAAFDMNAARAQEARAQEEMQMRRDAARQAAMDRMATATDAEREQAAERMQGIYRGLGSFYAAGDEKGASKYLADNGLPSVPFNQVPALLAQVEDGLAALETFQSLQPQTPEFSADRYRNVEGVGLVDLQAEGGPAPVDFGMTGGQTQTADPTELRKEWNAIPAVRQFAQQAETFGRVAAAAQDPSPAGDLALIYNFMKSLDPSSTVMAGEYANAQNTGSIDQRVAAIYNSVVDGNRLTDEQRADFLGRAAAMYRSSEEQYTRLQNQYNTTAQTANIDPAAAITDFRFRPAGQVPYVENRPQARPGSAVQVAAQPVAAIQAQGPTVIPTPGNQETVAMPSAADVPTMSDADLATYLANTPGSEIPTDVFDAIKARMLPPTTGMQ